jgi:hypothetical protein
MAKSRQIKKMLGGAIEAVCPPGFWCMDTGFLLFVLLILCALFAGVYFHNKTNLKQEDILKNIHINIVDKKQPAEEVNVPMMEARSTTHEYDRRSPTAPERYYGAGPDIRGFIPPPGVPVIPIQIPTQGLPEQFQQIGVLSAPGGTSTSASPNRTLLPLFGRKVAVAKDRYNYFTRSDGFNSIQVPVSYKNRSCEDDNGCDEIYSGETVAVPLLGQSFVATTYRYNLPRYIPYV